MRSDSPRPASKAAPPERDSSEKESQTPGAADPPKPPPLSKAKRKRPEATPDASRAESRSAEPGPKEKQGDPDVDERAAKTRPKRRRWLDEPDRRPLPDRPPLPRKVAAKEETTEDSRCGAPPKPPRVPSRPHRDEGQVERKDIAPEEPEREVVRGYEHDVYRRRTVYWLGIAFILAACFGAIPAVMNIVQNLRALEPAGVCRWAYVLLLASAIQLAYAVYLMQLPDWSTAWVVALVTLVMATGYAMFLAIAIAILARPDSQIIDILQLADNGYGKKAAGWCLIMLSISSLLAYFSGRISVRWRRAYDLVTRTAKE